MSIIPLDDVIPLGDIDYSIKKEQLKIVTQKDYIGLYNQGNSM